MGCLCLSRPGCHFNTGTPPSPPRFWRKLPKDGVNEEGLWGGQGLRLLPHSSSPTLPLCLSFLPESESEEQHKDLALEGKVLYSSRCMTLDKLCHSLQVNEGRTREPHCYAREKTASSLSHKPYCAPHSPGVCGNIPEGHPGIEFMCRHLRTSISTYVQDIFTQRPILPQEIKNMQERTQS